MRISYTNYTSTQIYHSDSQYRSRAAWISKSMELRDKLGKKPEQINRGTLELMALAGENQLVDHDTEGHDEG